MDKDGGEVFITYKSERRRAAEHLAETLLRHALRGLLRGEVATDDEAAAVFKRLKGWRSPLA